MRKGTDRTVKSVRVGHGGLGCTCCTIGTRKEHKTLWKRVTRRVKKLELAREVHNEEY